MIKKIYDLFFNEENNNKTNIIYNVLMILVIVISVFPLAFKESNLLFEIIDKITVSIFIVDYLLRWITAIEKYNKGVMSYIKYPFSFFAIIDLLSILPSFTFIASGFRLFKLFRLLRSLKVFRAFKMFRYSKNITMIANTIKKQKNALLTVFVLAVGYILVSALVMFNAEPNTFNNFFEAVYWATTSLTTVGYGDIYPVTNLGRIIAMFSSFVGIAIVALPAGILTAGYMEELNNKEKKDWLILVNPFWLHSQLQVGWDVGVIEEISRFLIATQVVYGVLKKQVFKALWGNMVKRKRRLRNRLFWSW